MGAPPNLNRTQIIAGGCVVAGMIAGASLSIARAFHTPVSHPPAVSVTAASVAASAPAPSRLGLTWGSLGDATVRGAYETAPLLTDPDVVALYLSLTNGDLSDAYASFPEYRAAKNEFERKRIEDDLRAKLQKRLAEVGTSAVVLRTNVAVGSYDFRRKAFPFVHAGTQPGMESFVRFSDVSASGDAALRAFAQQNHLRGRPMSALGAYVNFDNSDDSELFPGWLPVEESKAEALAGELFDFREMNRDVRGLAAFVLFQPTRAASNEDALEGVPFGQKQVYGTASRVVLATGTGRVVWVSGRPGTPEGALVADVPGVNEVAVDDAFVYWASKGTIARAPKAGGATAAIVEGEAPLWGLRVGASHVTWVARSGDKFDLKSAPKDGTGKPLLLARVASLGGFTADGANAYFSEQHSAKCDRPLDRILRVPLKGGAAATVVGGQECPRGLTVDPLGAVYWSGVTSNGQEVHRIGKAGRDLARLIQGTELASTASDGTYVFAVAPGAGAIYRANTVLPAGATAPGTTAILEGVGAASGLTVQEHDLLWLQNHRLMTASVEGGDARQLMTEVVAFAVDGADVIVAARDGRVLRAARSPHAASATAGGTATAQVAGGVGHL